MHLSDVDAIIQHAVYDPVARRERYLRTRQLQGHQTASPGPPKLGIGSRIIDSNVPGSSWHVSKAKMDAAVRQAQSDARQISAIQGRLNKLKDHLKELLAKQKQGNSSSDSKSSTSTSSTKASSKDSPPKTAKQKAAAKESLKKAQEARAKQQKAEPNKKTPPTLEEQISHTRQVIADVETKLRAAIESTRTQTALNGR